MFKVYQIVMIKKSSYGINIKNEGRNWDISVQKKLTKHKEDGSAGNTGQKCLLDIQITNSKITEVKSFL